MKDIIKDQIEMFIEDTTEMLYSEECNFNNADPTNGMRCYEKYQIEDLIKEVMQECITKKQK